MCIYCGTKKYRKIYEHHFGPIPKDENGRTFDIHHIDGNHDNNLPENLKAVSIKEHYDIHYARGDYAACHRLSKRSNIPPDEISLIGSIVQKKRVLEGNHNFLGPELSRRKLQDGTHLFIQPDFIEKMRILRRERGLKMVAEGTHHFVTNNPAKIEWTCNHCGVSGKGKSNFTRHHGDNCKSIRCESLGL